MAFLTNVVLPGGCNGSAVSRRGRAIVPLRRRGITATAAQPMHDRVLIKVDTAQSETPGGLFVAAEKEKEEKTGVVMAVAKGRFSPQGHREPIHVNVGDHVLWKDSYGSESFDKDGETFLALRYPSIIASWTE